MCPSHYGSLFASSPLDVDLSFSCFDLAGSATGQTLSWTRRIAAAIGVAKGIQFLHTGIVPGVLANNLKTTSILLDQNLVAKISSYDLPILEEIMRTEVLRMELSQWTRKKKDAVVPIFLIKSPVLCCPFDSFD